MIVAFIIGCEIGFWVLVLAGLVFRYVLRMKKSGAFLLYCTPIVDLVLLVSTVISLRDGTTATFAHALSALYIAFSIVFGHRMIKWADAQFAYRFAHGPVPQPKYKPKFGQEHASYERSTWLRYCYAWVIGCILLFAMITMVGNAERTSVLLQTVKWWSIITAVDFIYSFSFTLWPKQESDKAKTR